MADKYVSVGLEEIFVGEPLPCAIYVYLNFRFITFRASGDVIDRTTFDRLQQKKVKNLFVNEQDQPGFVAWSARFKDDEATHVKALTTANRPFVQAREDTKRKLYDIFNSEHPDKAVMEVIASSKKLVDEVIKLPFAAQTLAQLQTYSRGTVDHSVNVATLSVYLAMQMGYSHNLILQHVGAGALLHDIGKPAVDVEDDDPPDVVAEKMREHPTLGLRLIEQQEKVPNEVKMIIAQHHECQDGSGFPKKLRGSAIYDLARIVAIANVFDELVAETQGTLSERQRTAITTLDEKLYKKFDPQKLDKVLKILRLGV